MKRASAATSGGGFRWSRISPAMSTWIVDE